MTFADAESDEIERTLHLVTHELKADLRGLQEIPTWIIEDAAEEGLALPRPIENHLQLMSKAARRLGLTLERLSQYRRSGKAACEPRVERVRDAAEIAWEDLTAPQRFSMDASEAPERYQVSVADIGRVWYEVLENAIAHHPEDGGRVTVTSERIGGHITVWVEDDGPGIDPSMRERVFEPFYRLTRRDANNRAGLGLTIARKIMERAGGSIELRAPKLGSGCAVQLMFPAA